MRGEIMGYEQLPPEVPMWRQDIACKNCEKLETRIKVLEEDLADMFNVGPVCLECQRKAERIKVLEDALKYAIEQEEHSRYCDAIKGPEPETWLVEKDCNCWVKDARAALEVKP
jgi:hypothetical protein